ncbi:MAG: cyclic nucleotide-binding domain-containing protein [Proteobacteria bacterium]|nr:cyclic nucleotide-binding domain-containing protein [Pseudomonadota bacterium]
MTAQTILDRKLFPSGSVIFSEGKHGGHAYVVESGLVEISKSGPAGACTLGHIRPGGIFGEMALIDQQPRMATAIAVEDTVCIIVPESVVRESLRRATPFLRALVNILVQDLRSVTEELANRPSVA